VIEKTIAIFRNKKPKKPKIWTFGFFLGFLKNLGFLKAISTAPVLHTPIFMVILLTDSVQRRLVFNLQYCLHLHCSKR